VTQPPIEVSTARLRAAAGRIRAVRNEFGAELKHGRDRLAPAVPAPGWAMAGAMAGAAEAWRSALANLSDQTGGLADAIMTAADNYDAADRSSALRSPAPGGRVAV
jgi:uncharacterized protein YukE